MGSGRPADFRTLLDRVSDMVTLSDRDGRVIYANAATERVSGYPPDEFVRRHPFDDIHPEDRPRCEKALERLYGEPGLILDVEHRIRHADGGWRWVEGRFESLFDEPGIEGILATVRDTTDRRHAEEALRSSEERFRAFVEATSDAVYKMSADWREMRSLVGKEFIADTESPRGDWDEEYILEEDRARVWKTIHKAIESKTDFELEHRVIRPDGTTGWTFSRAVPMLDDAGEIFEWLGTASDIAGKKRAEEELRESEERQSFLLELSDALRPLADPVEVMAAASEALGRHLGAGRCGYGEVDESGEYFIVERDWTDEIMPSFEGRHLFVGFGPELVARYRAGRSVLIDDALTDARAAGSEAAFEAAGGVRASLGLPLIKDGRFVAGLFVQHLQPRHWTARDEALALDVAERTWAAVERARAEAALRESEERLQITLDAARMGDWSLDIETLEAGHSPAHDRIFGYTEPLPEWSYGKFMEHVHPEDRERVQALLDRSVETGDDWEFECRITRADGETRFVWVRGTLFSGRPGGARKIMGLVSDVTGRKRVEVALGENEERLRTLVEQSPLAINLITPDGTSVRINRAWEEFWNTGDETGDEPETNAFEDEHLEKAGLIPYLRMGMEGRESTTEPLPYDHPENPDGRMWLRAFVYPVFGGSGEVCEVVLMLQDVTESKLRRDEQDRLRDSEAAMRAEAAERERISRDLHDRVAHSMGVAHQSLELYSALSETNPKRAEERLEIAREHTLAALGQTRNLALELRRSVADEMSEGLQQAVRKLLETTVPPDTPTDFAFSGDEKILPREDSEQVYLIVREALSNVVRHSNCDNIHLRIEITPSEVSALVSDDGDGFEEQEPEAVETVPSGMGLGSMRERARMLGGEIFVKTKPENGTKITLHVPLNEK